MPAHYVVFHPERARARVKVRATALIDGQPIDSWVGKVWVDRPPGNEDPFVFGPSWAYSYCHATQLRREPRASGPYVSKGSCILFCSGDLADKEDVLAVDTVFWIGAAHTWRSPDEPPSRYAQDVSGRTDVWRPHLRFGGNPGGHKGRYTYEAALYPQPNDRYSRLPLGADGDRVRVPLSVLSHELRECITENLNGKYPALLSDTNLHELLASVKDRTAIEVVRNIVADDPRFIALREEPSAGRGPCQKEC